jgi:hypothetical protein
MYPLDLYHHHVSVGSLHKTFLVSPAPDALCHGGDMKNANTAFVQHQPVSTTGTGADTAAFNTDTDTGSESVHGE